MKFNKSHRKDPTEPQLAAMIDVFSILIIFLIAGTAMDSSVMNIPIDLGLAETSSKSTTLNAPQVTLLKSEININFIDSKLTIKDIENASTDSPKIVDIQNKLKSYLANIKEKNQKSGSEMQLLESVNLLADKNTPYKEVFAVVKFFRANGFQNTILIGVEQSGNRK